LQSDRSLGWRVRFVSAFDPLPLQLTVDHPLLELCQNSTSKAVTSLVQFSPVMKHMIRLMEEGGVLQQKLHKESRKRSRDSLETFDEANGTKSLFWAEVLCSDSENTCKQNYTSPKSSKQSTQTAKWVPIIPQHQSYDAPLDAEIFLSQLEENAANKMVTDNTKRVQPRKVPRRKAVSYVLAVEHPNTKTLLRLTDTTPRYSSSWSQTLRLRGAAGRELAKSGGKCVDEWWAECLKVINRQYICKSRGETGSLKSSGTTIKSETPVLVSKSTTSDGKEVEVLEIASSSDEEDSDSDNHIENKELTATMAKEPIPKSKAAFKQHPFYVIPSVLASTEVLHPDARKHICGVFKGEIGKELK
jgi:xeroderma pigmentosum group C-complementing protein